MSSSLFNFSKFFSVRFVTYKPRHWAAANLSENMQVLLLSLSVSVFVSSWLAVSRGTPVHLSEDKKPAFADSDGTEEQPIESGGAGEEFPDDVDFEDSDELEKPLDLGLIEPNINSVRHFHEKKGEVLIPCFGMWWPMGGPTYYDYAGGDYYGGGGDGGGKKRKRYRKRRKAAKSKKKKS